MGRSFNVFECDSEEAQFFMQLFVKVEVKDGLLVVSDVFSSQFDAVILPKLLDLDQLLLYNILLS